LIQFDPAAALQLAKQRELAAKKFSYLDLEPKANQQLTEDFHHLEGNTLKDLPQGEQVFEGVKFKVGKSAIQLAPDPDRPERVEGIQVKKTFRKLHILHATAYGFASLAEGTLIGEYLVHFEDDSVETIPIVFGEDVRDWWDLDNSKEVTRGKIAWTGVNEASRQRNQDLRLYLTTWNNPKRGKEVVSIDYVSKKTIAAPFCIAMTIEEEPAPAAPAPPGGK
jgi:hypothetical protein